MKQFVRFFGSKKFNIGFYILFDIIYLVDIFFAPNDLWRNRQMILVALMIISTLIVVYFYDDRIYSGETRANMFPKNIRQMPLSLGGSLGVIALLMAFFLLMNGIGLEFMDLVHHNGFMNDLIWYLPVFLFLSTMLNALLYSGKLFRRPLAAAASKMPDDNDIGEPDS